MASFVCFVLAFVAGLLATFVGASWITSDADLLRFQCLLALTVTLIAAGLAFGSRPAPR